MTRLLAVSLLCCAFLLPVVATADEQVPSVDIALPSTLPTSPDGWAKPPLIAQLAARGSGTILYRFGAGPGPWKSTFGSVVIPPGKQTLSAVLVGPDGVAGPVTQIIARSDEHAIPLSPAAAALVDRTVYANVPSTAGAVTVSVVVGRQLGAIIRRLGGTTRYGTATVISSAGFPRTGTVIIATGEKFPDALTASGLAGCLNAPVLLVHRTSIPTETRNELRRLGAKHAIICGGTPAVNDGVRKKLKAMGMSVERLSGKTRYETAVAISQRIQKLTGRASRVYVVPGTTFPDALIISPLAYKQRNPILLSSNSPLHPSTAKRMTAAHYTSAVLVGPELSGQTENGIRGRIASVERWAGSSQYDTAVQVASRACLDKSLSWSYVGIARGDLFPDGLCGGALSGRQGGVILLTPPTVLDAGVVNTLTAHAPDIARCEVYGSDKAITGPVYAQIQQILH